MKSVFSDTYYVTCEECGCPVDVDTADEGWAVCENCGEEVEIGD